MSAGPWRPEEGIGSSEAEDVGSSEAQTWVLETQLRFSARKTHVYTH